MFEITESVEILHARRPGTLKYRMDFKRITGSLDEALKYIKSYPIGWYYVRNTKTDTLVYSHVNEKGTYFK